MNELTLYILTSALFFLLLTGGAVFARAARLTEKTACALPFGILSLMAVQYIFSACGIMQAGPIFLLAVSSVFWIYSVIRCSLEKRCPVDAGIFVFGAVYAVLCYGNYGRRVQFVDAFTHWAAVVKIMCEDGLLSSSASAHLSHASYPPAMAMLQYLPQRIMHLLDGTRLYSEQYLYLAYESAVAAIPFYLTAKLPDGQKPIRKAFSAALFTVALFPFAPLVLRLLQIDGFMGLLLGLGFVLIIESKEAEKHTILAFSLLCFTLTLLKSAGILLALALCICMFFAAKKPERKISLWGTLASLTAYGSWKWLLKVGGATSKFDLSAGSFSASRLSLVPTILRDYLKSIFTGSVLEQETLLPCPWIVAIALLTVIALLALRSSTDRKRDTRVCIFSLSLCFVFFLALPFVYAIAFPRSEALVLASHARYLCVPLAGALIPVTYITCKYSGLKRLPVLLFIILLPLFPYKEPVRFLLRYEVRQSAAFAEGIDPCAEAVKKLPEGASAMLFTADWTTGNEKCALTYRFLPHRTEHIDKYNKKNYMEATGAATMAEGLRIYMEQKGYEYLYIHLFSEDFTSTYGALFEEGEPQNYTLYRLEDGMLRRVS